jgi:hypothetical protein
MKKLFLLLAAVLFTLTGMHAQATFADRMNLIWEIGPQFTYIENPGYLNSPTGKIKPNVALRAEYIIKDKISITAGLVYDPRGYHAKYQSAYLVESDTSTFVGYHSYFKYDNTYTANYLTFPVQFVYMSQGRQFRLFVQAGIYFSLYINGRQKTFSDYYIDQEDLGHFSDSTLTSGHHILQADQVAKGVFNTYDFGFNISVGIIYRWNSRISFKFTPGFNYGLAHAFENPEISAKWDRISRINAGIVYKLRPAYNTKTIRYDQ